MFKVHHSRLDETASAPELSAEYVLPTQNSSQILHGIVTDKAGITTVYWSTASPSNSSPKMPDSDSLRHDFAS